MPSEETVIQLPLSELHPFPNHPFKVRDDEAMRSMMESVSRYGVLTPAIVRPRQVYGGFVSFLVVDRHKKCGLSPAHPKHSRPSFEGLHNACAGRALEWHSRGQRFDPAYLHQETTRCKAKPCIWLF